MDKPGNIIIGMVNMQVDKDFHDDLMGDHNPSIKNNKWEDFNDGWPKCRHAVKAVIDKNWEEIKAKAEAKPIYRRDLHYFEKAVKAYGGSFMRALLDLLQRADSINTSKIISLWNEEVHHYIKLGKQMEEES